jgi:hypothetical protein
MRIEAAVLGVQTGAAGAIELGIDKRPARDRGVVVHSVDQAGADRPHGPAVRAVRPASVVRAGGAAACAAAGGGGDFMTEQRARMGAAIQRSTLIAVAFGVLCTAQQASAPVQAGFRTPDEAARELVQAAGDFDASALQHILGPESKGLVSTEDPVADKARATAFAALAHEKLSVVLDPKGAGRAQLLAGNDAWPFPIPIVRKNGKWYFDSKAGRHEILLRRVGENELDAIQICRGFVEAQQQYSLQRHDGVNQYAQRIISTPGTQDGLAWQTADGTWAGPVGENIAKALTEGYTPGVPPYHGYYFKVLKGQGPAAPLGEMEFVIGGIMIGGFALAAAPAEYKVTGVETFIVNHDGIVYQKDLGPETLTIFNKMEKYNPDKTWRVTADAP